MKTMTHQDGTVEVETDTMITLYLGMDDSTNVEVIKPRAMYGGGTMLADAEVNWSALGSVSPALASRYASLIQRAAWIAESLNRTQPKGYGTRIAENLARMHATVDPRHVEGHMRATYGTLDHLGPNEWAEAISSAVQKALETPDDVNEKLAESYGL